MLNRVSPFLTVCVSGRQSLPFLPLTAFADDLLAALVVADVVDVLPVVVETVLPAGVRSITGAGVVLQASSSQDSQVMHERRSMNIGMSSWCRPAKVQTLPVPVWSGGTRFAIRVPPDKESVHLCPPV